MNDDGDKKTKPPETPKKEPKEPSAEPPPPSDDLGISIKDGLSRIHKR